MTIDAATLAACRRGDARAFAALVLAYQQPVVSLCTALAGRDGEDLAQETFVRVLRAIRGFDPAGRATLRSWILVIARRLCHDRARHIGRDIERAVTADAASADDPRAKLESDRLRARVAAAIAQLPADQRAVIALREWEGIDYAEIAEIEGVPIGTVRSRLARARETLRELLAGEAREELRAHA